MRRTCQNWGLDLPDGPGADNMFRGTVIREHVEGILRRRENVDSEGT